MWNIPLKYVFTRRNNAGLSPTTPTSRAPVVLDPHKAAAPARLRTSKPRSTTLSTSCATTSRRSQSARSDSTACRIRRITWPSARKGSGGMRTGSGRCVRVLCLELVWSGWWNIVGMFWMDQGCRVRRLCRAADIWGCISHCYSRRTRYGPFADTLYRTCGMSSYLNLLTFSHSDAPPRGKGGKT